MHDCPLASSRPRAEAHPAALYKFKRSSRKQTEVSICNLPWRPQSPRWRISLMTQTAHTETKIWGGERCHQSRRKPVTNHRGAVRGMLHASSARLTTCSQHISNLELPPLHKPVCARSLNTPACEETGGLYIRCVSWSRAQAPKAMAEWCNRNEGMAMMSDDEAPARTLWHSDRLGVMCRNSAACD